MGRQAELFRRAKHIRKTEGLIQLVRRGFTIVVGHFFWYRRSYLFEYATENVRKLNEADFMPKIDNFTLKIVSSNQEADKLEADGLEFRSQSIYNRKALDKGAVAFCIFVEQELAYLGWVATTQEAKDSLNEPPYKVDFSKKESCTGGSVTDPKYRGMGLMGYNLWKRFEFLGQMDKVRDRAAVAKDNIPSQRATMRVRTKIHAEARYLRILWWESWKENPLP